MVNNILIFVAGLACGAVGILSIPHIREQFKPSYIYDYPFSIDIPPVHLNPASHQSSPVSYYAVDFPMPLGTPVLAARSGVVLSVRDDSDEYGTDIKYVNKVNQILILHEDNIMTEYNHLERNSAQVKLGDIVRVGDVLAVTGNSGYTFGPHLHFNVVKTYKNGKQYSLPVKFKSRDS
ncbi:MAG: murein DD-endopeptidase MepM/ murein hydrolase activator NlpD [Alteromonas naphthalenivorans]|jgi:murein DD-endopeptidase MepM/ murein hydrolase activator NlpD